MFNDGEQKPEANEIAPIKWSAPETYSDDRNKGWYIGVILAAIVAIAADLLWLRSYTFSVLAIVMVVALFVLAKKPSSDVSYTFTVKQGLYAGDHLYPIDDYKAFGVIKDHADIYSLVMIPTKRFSPALKAYFPKDIGERLVDAIGMRLPIQEIKPDVLDDIARRLKL